MITVFPYLRFFYKNPIYQDEVLLITRFKF